MQTGGSAKYACIFFYCRDAAYGCIAQGNVSVYYDTYYIYDGIGNLRAVLSPELLVQSHSGNHLNGFELEYTAYNFSGQPVKQLHVHSAAGESVLSEIYTYTYDDIGLPLAICHRLGNGTETILADKVYDALGRLLKGKRNGNL